MDQHLILVFPNVQAADTTLAAINALFEQCLQSQGHTITEHQIIGKNAETGEDMPSAARTVSWDVVKRSKSGVYYITSPTNDQRFVDYLSKLQPEVQALYTEQTMPEEFVSVIS